MSELIIKKLIWEQCGFTEVNGIFKFKDCQHCGDEWEYQCYECEREEEDMRHGQTS